MPQTDLPKNVRRPMRIIPIAVAFVIVAAGAIFAWSHLAMKGPGDHKDVTAEQVAEGQTPPTRDDYGAKDYVEPNKK